MSSKLFTPLTLPNGIVVSNRICKAAMEENLSDLGQLPGERLFTLYKAWSKGGAGLLLTGNVMISPDALTGPGGVVLESANQIDSFKQWAAAGTQNGNQLWMQINHPGRQVYEAMGEQALSPSGIALNIPGFSKMFAQPKTMTEADILDIIERFANTAALAEQSGFTGVQIHAAHGYLLSQFLSPLVNQRTDRWGGSLENRARLVFAVVKAVRSRVSAEFCVSIKINSADFQKGGFDAEDAKWVVTQLNDYQLDLVELSGGSYESPAMSGSAAEPTSGNSTTKREAYFVDFARDIAQVASMPIMVTGGITKRAVAEDALNERGGISIEMLGIARALAYQPSLPNKWKQDKALEVTLPIVDWKNKTLGALASMAITKAQLTRMAAGKHPKSNMHPFFALLNGQIKTKLRTRQYRKWRDG
ncbi:MAG: 2,4-dienoyl-CoA reductase-like NADH-dependent reductase (Old Yellow Enzyme family) [Arenicella sp.]|jgi:2,4-dienoyl-CoA reductase-like NADH-dependent reductase (Old Yellow Enzyme family)